MPDYEIRPAANGQGPVVFLTGELDLATAPQLRECLMDLRGEKVVLDFSDVTFMDSSALGIVVAARKRAEDNGGEIILHGVQPMQLRIFQITGLIEYMNFDGDSAVPEPG